MIPDGYPRRALTRGAAFIAASGVTGLLLALQVGVPRGAIPAAIYLVEHLSPFALIDALVVPAPRSGQARMARILLAFLLVFLLSFAWQWRAFIAVPEDLQMQIAVETSMRNVAFLGAYLAIEALLGALIGRRMPA